MLRGTRIITGDEVLIYNDIISKLKSLCKEFYFNEIIIPSIWEEETFTDKVGPENSKMMWRFKDKGDRNVCLIPEVTGICQEMWRNNWSKEGKDKKICYVNRCYRYEKPQLGRYREFTQFGIEWLGQKEEWEYKVTIDIIKEFLESLKVDYKFNPSVKRGLSYYNGDGFEIEVESLGAQKQICGGGKYAEGCGWALGVDILVLAIMKSKGEIK